MLRYARVLAALTTSHSHHLSVLLGPNAVTVLTTLSAIAPRLHCTRCPIAVRPPHVFSLELLIRSSFFPVSCAGHIPTLSYVPSAARVCLWWWMCAETTTFPIDFLVVPLLFLWKIIRPEDMFGSILRWVQGPLSASLTCLVSRINKPS